MQVYGDDVTFPSAVVSLLLYCTRCSIYRIFKKTLKLVLLILRVQGWRYALGKAVGIRVAKVYTASEVAVSVPDLP